MASMHGTSSGVAVMLLIAFAFSAHQRAIRWRAFITALLTQIGSALILVVPFCKAIRDDFAAGANRILDDGITFH